MAYRKHPRVEVGVIPDCPICSGKMKPKKNTFGGGGTYWRCADIECKGIVTVESIPKEKLTRPKNFRDFNFEKTPEQKAILLAYKRDLLVRARAGTGKTTQAEMLVAKRYNEDKNLKIVYMAFNTKIRDEAFTKFPRFIEVTNWNRFGLQQIKKIYPTVKTNPEKMFWIFWNLMPTHTKPVLMQERMENAKFRGMAQKLQHLAELCKYHLLDGNEKEEIAALMKKYQISFDDDESYALSLLYPAMITSLLVFPPHPKTGEPIIEVDYADQLYWCIKRSEIKRQITRFDVLVGDEAQDWDFSMRAMAMLVGKQLIFVGDEHQAIYGFKGADTDSLPNLKEKMIADGREVHEFPLSVTQRCASSIVFWAQKLVPDIYARDDAQAGEVDWLEDLDVTTLDSTSMVLCRTNAPLASVAMRMMQAGNNNFLMSSPKFGEDLIELIMKIGAKTIVEFQKGILDWHNSQMQRLKSARRPNTSAMMTVADTYATLLALSKNVNEVKSITQIIAKMFDQSRPRAECTLLYTGHSSKGLERETVYIISPELYPHPMAKQDWELLQERNLLYVMLTRAKRQLFFVGGIPAMLVGV